MWKVPKLILEFRKLNNKEAVENLTNNLTESVNLDQLHELLVADITLLTCSVVRALYPPVSVLLQMLYFVPAQLSLEEVCVSLAIIFCT